MTPGTDWIDQAQRLVEAVRDNLAAAVPPAAAPESDAGGHPADCSWCPVCQVAAVVRGERPEITAALADLLTTAATALRTVAEAGRTAEPASEPAQDSEPPAPVQQIEIA
ncbi:MAG: hypothetical protein AVDCRST_MAG52-3285 [uncultured Blastococcus sp.]|uniref:Uncharacterized protein n=1 Tax=uncultured Blastococcus sp. TaxID=217144 RepID=A0A6J4J8D1_9ACTN|nr:MAG: hypothetical protein AVDCRST_MAG52-3285 [uncultured Blastococcus sp.]